MDIILLIVGLVRLWLGTELTIRGAISIANKLAISEFVVGVAILSIGSDLPELTIAIDGAIRILQIGQASDVVVGSAISGLDFDAKMLRGARPFLLALSALVLIFLAKKKGLQKHDAAIVLVLYCGYALVRFNSA